MLTFQMARRRFFQLSRKYSEMKLANLSGAGKGLLEAGVI